MIVLKRWFVLSVFLGMILPGVLVLLFYSKPKEPEVPQSSREETILPEEKTEIWVLIDGKVCPMELESYITGVVLGEMPAGFHLEALKAQAVVARTYTMKMESGSSKHTIAAVCTDSSCCQAYISEEEYLSAGGSKEHLERVRDAVSTTVGQVLTYEGTLIEATYFSCSGGRTEDAQAVWGSDIPYLQSTESPGEEGAAHYTDTVTFSINEFCELLGVSLSGQPGSWLGKVTYTEGGGVDTIEIGGKTYKGTAIRQKLGLRSTAFTLTVVGDTLSVTTKGFGHRVGMSQYGADAMAVSGSNYRQILAHYYSGTQLQERYG